MHLHPVRVQTDFYNVLSRLSDNTCSDQEFVWTLVGAHILAGGIIGLRTLTICAWILKRFARSTTRLVAGSVILSLQAASVIVLMDMSLQTWVESTIGFPTDSKLIVEFQRTGPQLDKIVAALSRSPILDRIGSCDGDGDRNYDGLPVLMSAQIRPYRLLLRSAGVFRASILGPGDIRFAIWSSPEFQADAEVDVDEARLDHGASKGYEYLAVTPVTTPWSLHGFNLPSKENGTIYRHISGNWYLYYDCWREHEVGMRNTNRPHAPFLPVSPARAIISEAIMSTKMKNSARPRRNAVVALSGNGGVGNGGIEQITRRLSA